MNQTDFIDVKSIPKELVTNILQRKVVPFIGAGFSLPFGYPSWKNLIIGIKDKLEIDHLENKDLENVDPLQIAQALFHYYSKISFDSCKKEILNNLNIKSKQIEDNEELRKLVDEQTGNKLELDFSRIILELITPIEDNMQIEKIEKLKMLNQLEFNSIVTTNYDKVLEDDIFISKAFKVQSLGKNEELDWNEKDKAIIKIHGDKESNFGVIFTHSQYYKFMNESGYFRSKLYTIFSSNIVLMMGYGFNDINVHQIYFQFLRDYGKNINSSKFYMVLTAYEMEKWNSYFEFYKYYLESYKIQILVVEDLPTFIENLVESVNNERESKSLENLFEMETGGDFGRIMMATISQEYCDVTYDPNLYTNILNAFIKIFKDEYLLSMDPFNLKDFDFSSIGEYILDYTVDIFEKNNELIETKEFNEILHIAIEFADRTRDFYSIKYRLKAFIDLNKYITQLEEEELLAKQLYSVFGYCHPTQFLKSNPGGNLLKERIQDLNIQVIKAYLEYILKHNIDSYEETIYLDNVHKYWLNLIETKFKAPEIRELIDQINGKLDN